MARPQRRGNEEEAQMLAQLQMAMHMSRADHRNDERQMIMMALAGGAGAQQAQEEEDRLLQRAIEESKNDAQDPNHPDVDRMTYEQLMELGDNAGQVSRGYSQAEISSMQKNVWYRGRTKESSCLICMEDFSNGELVKILPCGHEYKAKCIDEWLKKEKRCPICSQPPM